MLARSFAEHHPDGRFWTLVIDDFAEHIEPGAGAVRAAHAGRHRLRAVHGDGDPLQRARALDRGQAVAAAPSDGARPAGRSPTSIPTSRCTARSSGSTSWRLAHGLVLTPHNSRADPAGRAQHPSQVDIMIAGVYNLGYVSLAAGAGDRPAARLVVGPAAPRLPRRSGVRLLRRPALVRPRARVLSATTRSCATPSTTSPTGTSTAASWSYDGGRYIVDGQPLAFFHFSGFDPDRAAGAEPPPGPNRRGGRPRAGADPRRVRGGGHAARVTLTAATGRTRTTRSPTVRAWHSRVVTRKLYSDALRIGSASSTRLAVHAVGRDGLRELA